MVHKPLQQTTPICQADRSPALAGEASVGEQQLDVLQQLAREIQQLETGRGATDQTILSAGCAALDACLPEGGYRAGSVVEYLRCGPACGATTLAWAAAAEAQAVANGFVVVIDTLHTIYPPALASQGIRLSQVIWVRPESQADAIWAIDQSLRTPGIAAVVAELERIDDRSARRLQLAAESGSSLALLLRSAAARQQPSWAEVQWLVRTAVKRTSPLASVERPSQFAGPAQRRLELQLARVRGGQAGSRVVLEIDSLTGKLKVAPAEHPPWSAASHRNDNDSAPSQSTLHLASQLAHTKSRVIPGSRTAAG